MTSSQYGPYVQGCTRATMAEHLLLVVIAGNTPKAEFTDLAYERIKEFENSQ